MLPDAHCPLVCAGPVVAQSPLLPVVSSAPQLCPRLCVLPPAPQFALGLVVKESFKVYKAVSEGVINLADAFFEMEYHDAGGCLLYV